MNINIGDIVNVHDTKIKAKCQEFQNGVVIALDPHTIVFETEHGAMIWTPCTERVDIIGKADDETLSRCNAYINKKASHLPHSRLIHNPDYSSLLSK